MDEVFADRRTKLWLVAMLAGTALAVRAIFLEDSAEWPILQLSVGSTFLTFNTALAARGAGIRMVDAGTWGYGLMPFIILLWAPGSLDGGLALYRLLGLCIALGILHGFAFRTIRDIATEAVG